MPMRRIAVLLVLALSVVACKNTSAPTDPGYPQNPDYPMVAYEREFEMDGADTIWGGRVDYQYDSLGRYLSLTRHDASGQLTQQVEYFYDGVVETMMVYGSQHQLLRKVVYTFLDTSYRREPAYEGAYYRNFIKCEEFDPQGTLLAVTNHCYDNHLRIAQTDGFDVESGILYVSNIYYPYGSDYTVVKNPKSVNEEATNGNCTYADSTCHYPLTNFKQLKSGIYEQHFTYDTLGRRLTHIGTLAGVTVDDIEYVYLDEVEYEIDHANCTQIIRFYKR